MPRTPSLIHPEDVLRRQRDEARKAFEEVKLELQETRRERTELEAKLARATELQKLDREVGDIHGRMIKRLEKRTESQKERIVELERANAQLEKNEKARVDTLKSMKALKASFNEQKEELRKVTAERNRLRTRVVNIEVYLTRPSPPPTPPRVAPADGQLEFIDISDEEMEI